MSQSATRFQLRFAPLMVPLAAPLGMWPSNSWVDLSDDALEVRMGVFAFFARVPLSSIAVARPMGDLWTAIGIHTDFQGSWAVNGSPRGMVELVIEPEARGQFFGFSVPVRRLAISLDDPPAFLAALNERRGRS
ncbi:MAG: hypothetical protein U0821_07855 [Chloroflexota bacterium]